MRFSNEQIKDLNNLIAKMCLRNYPEISSDIFLYLLALDELVIQANITKKYSEDDAVECWESFITKNGKANVTLSSPNIKLLIRFSVAFSDLCTKNDFIINFNLKTEPILCFLKLFEIKRQQELQFKNKRNIAQQISYKIMSAINRFILQFDIKLEKLPEPSLLEKRLALKALNSIMEDDIYPTLNKKSFMSKKGKDIFQKLMSEYLALSLQDRKIPCSDYLNKIVSLHDLSYQLSIDKETQLCKENIDIKDLADIYSIILRIRIVHFTLDTIQNMEITGCCPSKLVVHKNFN